jgi:hypothetical protein
VSKFYDKLKEAEESRDGRTAEERARTENEALRLAQERRQAEAAAIAELQARLAAEPMRLKLETSLRSYRP